MTGSGVTLPGAERVTLCAVDCVNPVHALLALDISLAKMAFADAVFLSDTAAQYALPGVRMVTIPKIESAEDYSRFMLKELGQHFTTSHVLLVQWDGHVVNPSSWRPEFLDYDFIGAPWGFHEHAHCIGNGGFSLRSRRLCDALLDPEVIELHPEDEAIGRRYRPLLESRYGIQFPDRALASVFSFETTYPDAPTFGFHGLFNMWMVIPPTELGRFVEELSGDVVGGKQYLQLARNYWELGRQEEAIVALRCRVRRHPADREAAELLSTWLAAAPPAAGGAAPAVGRNDPCPCGSGKRFKFCCGQLGRGSGASTPPASPQEPGLSGARFAPKVLLDEAMALHQAGQFAKAEAIYRQVLAISPDNSVALQYLGVLSLQKGDPVAAETLVRRALAADDDIPEFHSNLGHCLAAQGRLEEASVAYRQAIALRPNYATAHSNLGLDLQALGRAEEAIASFEEAITHAPDFAEAHWNLSLARLLLGQYESAWPEYEWRVRCQAFERDRLILPGSTPWKGEPLTGRSLLVRQEQGAGDTIQFLRFLPGLARQAREVAVEVAPELASLAAAALPGAKVVRRGTTPTDFYVNLMSLPLRLGTTLDNIPPPLPLEASPEARSTWAERLLGQAGYRVGLVWAGNPAHTNDKNRSCPPALLEPLLDVTGCAWFSLQKGGAGLPPAWRDRVVDLGPSLHSYEDTAAAVSALDLVIAVDTSVAHLSASLGRLTWVLLPFAPDWRWLLDRSDSPWYPSVRLFRQPTRGNWPDLVDDVARALRMLVAVKGPGGR